MVPNEKTCENIPSAAPTNQRYKTRPFIENCWLTDRKGRVPIVEQYKKFHASLLSYDSNLAPLASMYRREERVREREGGLVTGSAEAGKDVGPE